MSKKRPKKKPRAQCLTVDFGAPTTIDAVYCHPLTGEVRFLNNGREVKPQSASVERSYDRPKGPKVLVRTNVSHENAYANPNRALEQYNEIYAVDTNTKVIVEPVSVCAIVGGTNVLVPGHTAIRYRPIHCMEYRGAQASPEKIAWVEVIEGILQSPMYSCAKRYLVIVDAYLGELAAFNDRSRPLLEGFYLPPQFTLAYASADASNESVANLMLSLADKIASTILNGIEKKAPDGPFQQVYGKPYKSRRLWTVRA